jgi:hypothetical protein
VVVSLRTASLALAQGEGEKSAGGEVDSEEEEIEELRQKMGQIPSLLNTISGGADSFGEGNDSPVHSSGPIQHMRQQALAVDLLGQQAGHQHQQPVPPAAAADEQTETAATPAAAAAAAGSILAVGTAVQARHAGGANWYEGKITGTNTTSGDGNGNGITYSILYADGDSESAVLRYRIRVPGEGERTGHGEELRIGEPVDSRHGGGKQPYPGVIAAVNRDDGGGGGSASYDVNYDDGDKETGVPRALIYALCAPGHGGGVVSGEDWDDDEDDDDEDLEESLEEDLSDYDDDFDELDVGAAAAAGAGGDDDVNGDGEDFDQSDDGSSGSGSGSFGGGGGNRLGALPGRAGGLGGLAPLGGGPGTGGGLAPLGGQRGLAPLGGGQNKLSSLR